MRVVFFGTPEIAIPALDALLDSRQEVVGVVTRPDRPRGRSGKPVESPVRSRAQSAGLRVLTPERPEGEGFLAKLAGLAPDCIATCAYGGILAQSVLDLPPRGCVNLHFSLLPAYRGAAPVQRALLAGERTVGVCTFRMTAGTDEGPIYASLPVEVDLEENSGDLKNRLAVLGAGLLLGTLDGIEEGAIVPVEQDHDLATYAPKVTPAEAQLDWRWPAYRLARAVRAFTPSPGAWTLMRGHRLKVLRARAVDGRSGGAGVIELGAELRVGTGEGWLELLAVQMEGKRPVGGADFARGARIESGDLLGGAKPG